MPRRLPRPLPRPTNTTKLTAYTDFRTLPLVALSCTHQQSLAHHEILACPVPFVAITTNDSKRGRKESGGQKKSRRTPFLPEADPFFPELVSQRAHLETPTKGEPKWERS